MSYYNYFVRPQGISFSDFLARGTLKNPLATEFGVYRSVEVNMFMNTVLPQFQFIVIVEYFEECLGYSRL